jgi:hypothetical protein
MTTETKLRMHRPNLKQLYAVAVKIELRTRETPKNWRLSEWDSLQDWTAREILTFVIVKHLTTYRRHKTISKQLVRPPGKNQHKPFTETSFSISTPGTTGCWKTQEKKERSRSPWALRKQVLRTSPCLCSRRRWTGTKSTFPPQILVQKPNTEFHLNLFSNFGDETYGYTFTLCK